MGRLNASARAARLDRSSAARAMPQSPRSTCPLALSDAAQAAYYTGRSCYFRPLFDRSRQWAAQRAPRPVAAAHKPSDAA